jgi:hypothetical protein
MLAWIEDSANAELAFYVGAVCFTAAWNLDWRHYIRYWQRFGATSPKGMVVMRVLFAVWFLVAFFSLVAELITRDLEAQDYLYAVIFGGLLAVVVFALDGIMRFGHWLAR